MNTDELKALAKNDIAPVSTNLNAADIRFLVETLNEKDDKLRYNAFLLLQSNSRMFPSVYEYWGELEKKLDSDNSYQRSLGIMLIAENVRWDKEGRFGKTISKYLGCCSDEKFITARQTIQGLEIILKATDKFNDEIKQVLANLQLSQYKENQKKLLNKDISNVLKIINQ
ncbi:MAG: hypothetical protein M1167_04420 [Chloroflexi bacterium]|nr:hypothetical protein [Chloroflexota bacterium]